MLSTVTVYRSYQHLVCCYIVMSKVIKCQMSWNVKSHAMANVKKCQMSINIMKCQMSWNFAKFWKKWKSAGKSLFPYTSDCYVPSNILGNICQLNLYVDIGYSMPTLGGWMWVGVFLCALRVHVWGMYNFRNIYLYWIYDANNLGSICHLKIYVDIGYIMPTLGGWM